MRKLGEIAQRRIAQSHLYPSHVGPIEIGDFGEPFLRPSLGFAEASDSLTNGLGFRWVRTAEQK